MRLQNAAALCTGVQPDVQSQPYRISPGISEPRNDLGFSDLLSLGASICCHRFARQWNMTHRIGPNGLDRLSTTSRTGLPFQKRLQLSSKVNVRLSIRSM